MQTLAPYLRSMTFDASAGAYVDADGIKTSIATAASVQTYLPTFNGVAGNTVGKSLDASNVTHTAFASYPTVTNTSATGSYVNASTVVFHGTYGREVVTRTATLTSADGGQTLLADGPLDMGSITKIVVAAQVDTAGAFTFGWRDICPKKGFGWIVVAREAGTIRVENSDGDDDATTLAAHGMHLTPVSRIYSSVTIDLSVYEYYRP